MRVVNKYLLDCQEVRNGKRGRGRVAMSSVEGGGLSRFIIKIHTRTRWTIQKILRNTSQRLNSLFTVQDTGAYMARNCLPHSICEEGNEGGDNQENDYKKILYFTTPFDMFIRCTQLLFTGQNKSIMYSKYYLRFTWHTVTILVDDNTNLAGIFSWFVLYCTLGRID